MKKQECYSIKDIAEWRNDIDVYLPNVQRGFVWKPSQIENLWDSLLRGYPVGAIVLSQTSDEPETKNNLSISKSFPFELLDGQQRVTAIRLGFGTDTFRQSEKRFKIFIDLAPPSDSNLKYQFRVITSSHPWGYQRKDNTKPLDADNIRKAMKLYDIEDHLDFVDKLDNFFPFDSVYPIPFEYFVNAAISHEDVDELHKKIKSWGKKIKNNSEVKTSRIAKLLCATKKMLEVKIPALFLDYSLLEPDRQESNVSDNNKNSLEDSDEVENLFIRLNAGGTPLRGEELNYSILKARIDRDLQDRIEKSCSGLLAPSRFITIAYRLYQHQLRDETNDALSMRLKPKQFQKTMTRNEKGFKEFLQNILAENKFGNKTLLEYAKYVLRYDNVCNSSGFPYLIYSKIASEAPEVMFMLLYRLLIMKDLFEPQKDDKAHKRMLGMISLFLWLGKGESLRDHSKLLSNIWPAVIGIKSAEFFWSSSTIQRAMLNDALLSFPSLKKLNPFGKPIATTDILSKDKDNEVFFRKIFFERDLVLYAQRNALSIWFNEQHFGLDDTNVPFDWDHISPNTFCHSKKNIPKAVKTIYNSNGNFRAWPYSLNRFDQDDVPAKKLNPLLRSQNSLDKDADEKVNKLLEYLNTRYDLRLSRNKSSENKLKKTLLEWSVCPKGWLDCTEINLKNRKSWNEVFKLIMDRNISICAEWYDQLSIDSLMPESNDVDLGKLLGSRWISNPEALKVFFDADYKDNSYWFFEIDTSTGLYLGYENEDELAENAIEFGIVGDDMNVFIKNKSPEKIDVSLYEVGERWIGSTFTLISNDDRSYVELLSNMTHWLEKFPNKLVREFSSVFTRSLSNKMQRALQLKKT